MGKKKVVQPGETVTMGRDTLRKVTISKKQAKDDPSYAWTVGMLNEALAGLRKKAEGLKKGPERWSRKTRNRKDRVFDLVKEAGSWHEGKWNWKSNSRQRIIDQIRKEFRSLHSKKQDQPISEATVLRDIQEAKDRLQK